MKRLLRADIPSTDWDAIVLGSQDGWVWALTVWLDMIGQVPRWSLEDRSFAIEQDGQIVAVVPLHYIAAGRRLASSGWGWVGPVLTGGLHPRYEARVLKTVFTEMRIIAELLGAERVEVASPAVTPRSLANRWGVNPFSAHGFADVSTVTRVIDLGIDEASLWAGLSADARQQIRRARESGYSAAIDDWASVVEDYQRVHAETYARSGLPAHPREYFDGFARRIGPAGLSVLMVGRSPEGRPVAFHNTVRLGVAAIYSTGCSETSHLNSGINYLVFWEAMLAAKQAGCRWYEAGDVAPASKDVNIRGLTTFKTKFGGEDHRYFRGALSLGEGKPAPTFQGTFVEQKEAVAQWCAATWRLGAAFLRLRRSQPPPAPESTPEPPTGDAATRIRAAYQGGDLYAINHICAQIDEKSRAYADQLLTIKLALVRRYYRGGVALDLCCATGGHLIALAGNVERGIGVDFAARYVQRAQADAAAAGHHHLSFVCADAKHLPLPANCAGLLYSLSSLYAIPSVGDVFDEIVRVLAPGGIAILDLGNSRSLNSYCLRTGYKHWPTTFPIPIGQMRHLCADNNLNVIEHRCFQLLPLWAGEPKWLWPLLHPAWRRFLQRRVAGRMLDEWVSSLPVLRAFAFRHLLVCQKAGA